MNKTYIGFSMLILFCIIGAGYLYYHFRIPPSLYLNRLELETLDGKPLRPDIYENKIVVLSFYKSWCGPCISEMGQLEELSNQFEGNLLVICVSDETLDKQANVAQRFLSGKIFFVNTKTSFKELGIHTFPTNYLLNKKGEKVIEESGKIEWLSQDITTKLKSLIDQ